MKLDLGRYLDTLSKEKAFEGEIRIEAVKPQHNEDYLERFNQFSDKYIKFIKTSVSHL
ncbi:MAG: hypothetical protein IE881_04915 [Epsilonproteobacteria bacterium]|nr:hypothetical protein [Campylobacterota bacterium]